MSQIQVIEQLCQRLLCLHLIRAGNSAQSTIILDLVKICQSILLNYGHQLRNSSRIPALPISTANAAKRKPRSLVIMTAPSGPSQGSMRPA